MPFCQHGQNRIIIKKIRNAPAGSTCDIRYATQFVKQTNAPT
nr:MAG TPA: hypothetical protein [Caudoviricetes sp.]